MILPALVQRPGIVHRSEVGDRGRSTQREFMEIQLAEDNRAGSFQTHDNFCIFGRNAVFEDAARGGRPDAGRIDVVLQRDGNAVQRPAPLAALLFGFHFARRRERLLSRDRDERVDHGVELIDSLEARLSEIDRRCTSPSKKIGSLLDGQTWRDPAIDQRPASSTMQPPRGPPRRILSGSNERVESSS